MAWLIGLDIADGLAFLHKSNHVHRDLKPQNSFSSIPIHTNTLVLYCGRNETWKITDFGFTSDGMSSAKTTLYGRGTTGYRAPDLLGQDSERPRFSNRSDIWALGCILHEIITGRPLFMHDFATFEYQITSS